MHNSNSSPKRSHQLPLSVAASTRPALSVDPWVCGQCKQSFTHIPNTTIPVLFVSPLKSFGSRFRDSLWGKPKEIKQNLLFPGKLLHALEQTAGDVLVQVLSYGRAVHGRLRRHSEGGRRRLRVQRIGARIGRVSFAVGHGGGEAIGEAGGRARAVGGG